MRTVQNILTPSSGTRLVSNLTSVAGIGASETTLITINDNAVIKQWENHGVPTHRLKGDGRLWVKILTSAPASPTAGDVWLELDGMLGTVLRFFDGITTFTLTTEPPAGTLILTATAALLQGHALRALSGGVAYANVTVDSAKQYRVIGVAKEDTLISGTVEILTPGDILILTDWTLLTGALHLVENATYWLSSTPGRYTTTPNATVASKVGIAVSPTQLLIQPDLVVLS